MTTPATSYAPSEIGQIAEWLVMAGLAGIEISSPGDELRLRVAQEGTPAAAQPAPLTLMVRAPGFGVLLWSHPLRDAPLAVVGGTVTKGQVVALLRTGLIYAPVRAPKDGVVTWMLQEEGGLLGFGKPVLELAVGAT